MSLSVNALLPCGTETARRRHMALAEVCPDCEPDIEWSTRCPTCHDRVTVVGARMAVHDVEGVEAYPCRESGAQVRVPRRRAAVTARPVGLRLVGAVA